MKSAFKILIITILLSSCGPKMKTGWPQKLTELRAEYGCHETYLTQSVNNSKEYGLGIKMTMCAICDSDSISQKSQAYKLANILLQFNEEGKKYKYINIYFSKDLEVSNYTQYQFVIAENDSLIFSNMLSCEPNNILQNSKSNF